MSLDEYEFGLTYPSYALRKHLGLLIDELHVSLFFL